MKNYLFKAKGNSRQPWARNHVVVFFLVGVVALFVTWFAPPFLRSVAAGILTPVAVFEEWVLRSSATVPTFLRTRASLNAELASLRQSLSEYDNATTRIAVLEEENRILREQLGATTTSRIAASVIARPTVLPYDVFLIDRGSVHGVRERAPVYTAGDQVIGFVGRVEKQRSLVVLVSSPNRNATAYIYGPDIYTTAVGMGGGVLRVSVPQGITLSVGDPVILPSLDRGIYGEIVSVESDPSRPEQYGYVASPHALRAVSTVSVGSEALPDMTFAEAEEVVRSVRTDVLDAAVPEGILIDTAEATTTAPASGDAATTSTTSSEAGV